MKTEEETQELVRAGKSTNRALFRESQTVSS